MTVNLPRRDDRGSRAADSLRVYPADDAGLAALAVAAVGDRVAIADDGQPGYGRLIGDGFAAAARTRG